MEEHGSAATVAAIAGTTSRSIERAKRGRAGEKLMRRLRAAARGEVVDGRREERLALYEHRAEQGLGVFTGAPAGDPVSVEQLAREAEDE